MKRVAIIGGMGPRATAFFHQQLVEYYATHHHAKEDIDYPELVITSLPIPGFHANGKLQEKKAKEKLLEAMHIAIQSQSQEIVFLCNTIHEFLPELIEKKRSYRVISLITTAMHAIPKKTKTIGILSSQETRDSGLYTRPLKERKKTIIYPSVADQAKITKVIAKLMAGKEKLKDFNIIETIIFKLLKQGAEKIIISCTELSMLTPYLQPKTKLIDPVQEVIKKI